MALTPGARVGPYEIVTALGAGGMGEVYRARDARLDRDVAIKVLSDFVAADAQRMARFVREAQLLASISHPNIAAVYGLEECDGRQAIVQELIEGPTLSDLIARRALPLREALDIARGIAGALEAAHQRGIIHRDLKPANVKLTADHRVKVLDFGLAKSVGDDAKELPETIALTQTGVVLGTPGYMSPEQACGIETDRRADIWAFGTILFEMISGGRAFPGRSAAEVIGAVLHTSPDWTTLPPNTPPAIRRLLRRCLERDPKQRLRDIGDALLELDEPGDDAVTPPPIARRAALPALLALAGLVAGGLLVWTLQSRRPAAATDPIQFTIQIPADVNPERQSVGRSVAISPDGRRIVVVGTRAGGPPQLWVRSLDGDATPIAGTENGAGPFFSPDGRWVGFFVQGKLKKVALAGGAPVPVCNVERTASHGSWGTDDFIVFSGPKLWRVSAQGSEPEVLLAAEGGGPERAFRLPDVLPGAGAVLYTDVTGEDLRFEVGVLSVKTRQRRTLVRGATNPVFVDPGYVVYAQQVSSDSGEYFGGLFAVAFDPATLQTKGAPFPVLDGVFVRDGGAAIFATSRGGTLAYLPRPSMRKALVSVDRDGTATPISDLRADIVFPRAAPDGRHLSITRHGANRGLLSVDAATGSFERLTTTPGEDQTAIWSPDSRRLAFGSDERGAIWLMGVNPPTRPELLASLDGHVHLTSWSPDGALVAFEVNRAAANWDIGVVDVRTRAVRMILKSRASEQHAAFSPDGRWLAYTSGDSGRSQIYVAPFPGLEPRHQVSVQSGREPRWAPNGKTLFFRQGNAVLESDISLSPEFSSGSPRALFEGTYVGDYDVMPDGRHFAMLQVIRSGDEPPLEVHVVLNWFEALRRKADQTTGRDGQ